MVNRHIKMLLLIKPYFNVPIRKESEALYQINLSEKTEIISLIFNLILFNKTLILT